MDVAFIGAGSIAAKHRENLQSFSNVSITAVCDIDEQVATSVAKEHDASAYIDHECLYENERLDAVFLVVPPFARTDQDAMAVERDIALFAEKPVGLSTDRTEAVRSQIEAAGIVNQAGYVLRFSEVVERARELVSPENISLAEGRYFYPDVPEAAWWRERAKSGGQVIEQSTHMFDLVRYLFGDVNRISATGSNRHVEAVDFSDTTIATVHHDSGVVSQIESSISTPVRALDLRILGPEVDLTIDLLENELYGTAHGEDVDFMSDVDPFHRELEAFVAAVSNGEQNLVARSSYAEAVETLRLTLAVNRSLDKSEHISV